MKFTYKFQSYYFCEAYNCGLVCIDFIIIYSLSYEFWLDLPEEKFLLAVPFVFHSEYHPQPNQSVFTYVC